HISHLYDPSEHPWLTPEARAALDAPLLNAYRQERRQPMAWLDAQNLEVNRTNYVLNELFVRLQKAGLDVNSVLFRLALDTIRRHPVEYAESVAQNFYSWFARWSFWEEPYQGKSLAASYVQM